METSTNSHYVAGMAFFDQKKFQQATDEFKRAINDEPKNPRFWTRLGWTFLEMGENREAVNALTSAIQIDPKHENAFWWRGNAYENLHEYELCLLDRASFFSLKPESAKEWKGEKPDPNLATMYSHVKQSILPSLASVGDSLVWYTPCLMRWGKQKDVSFYGGTSFSRTKINCGTGFCMVTQRSVVFVSFGLMTQKDTYWDQSVGLRFLNSLANDKEEFIREKTDKTWKLPHSSIKGYTSDEHWIYLDTPGEKIELFPYFGDEQAIMATAFEMCISGTFTKPLVLPKVEPKQSNDEIMKLLQQLGDLKAQGILTEAEFEEKKKELLARL